MSERAGDREFALYLVGVTGISVASIAMLYVAFAAGLPRFLSGFVRDPFAATRTDPATVVVVVAGIVLSVLLVALVVVFGATYGPVPDREES